jgi:hypothetical protein
MTEDTDELRNLRACLARRINELLAKAEHLERQLDEIDSKLELKLNVDVGGEE